MSFKIRYGLAVTALLASTCGVLILGQSPSGLPLSDGPLPKNISQVERDDPGMEAAMRMGNETAPMLRKLMAEDAAVPLAAMVKLRFSAGSSSEYIWARLTHETAEGLMGELLDDPVLDIGDFQKGSVIRVNIKEVVDWSFESEKTTFRGNFTGCYLVRAGNDPAAAAYLESNPAGCEWAEAYRIEHSVPSTQIPR